MFLKCLTPCVLGGPCCGASALHLVSLTRSVWLVSRAVFCAPRVMWVQCSVLVLRDVHSACPTCSVCSLFCVELCVLCVVCSVLCVVMCVLCGLCALLCVLCCSAWSVFSGM